jgi:hypothetical protein
LPFDALPGRNSCTRPFTATASPAFTSGAEEVKTKMPSEVAVFASGFGSCIQKPFEDLASTIPCTFDTSWPAFGERCAEPWMSWIGVGVDGAAVVKLQVMSAAGWSGGSFVSWSETCAATIVTVQLSPAAKSESGSSVKVVGPPPTAAVWGPLVAHEIEYHEPVTSTGSLNVTETLAAVATSVASIPGERAVTDGAASAPA